MGHLVSRLLNKLAFVEVITKKRCLHPYSFFFFFNLFIYLFLAVLGLRFCARALSSCGKRGPLFITVRRPLTITASLVVEHRLQTRRLSNRGSRAQVLRGMWDLPRPGLEPVCPALAGRFSTTAPPGKPCTPILDEVIRSTQGCKLLLRDSMHGCPCNTKGGGSQVKVRGKHDHIEKRRGEERQWPGGSTINRAERIGGIKGNKVTSKPESQ